jgi:hypothetical protein
VPYSWEVVDPIPTLPTTKKLHHKFPIFGEDANKITYHGCKYPKKTSGIFRSELRKFQFLWSELGLKKGEKVLEIPRSLAKNQGSLGNPCSLATA